MKLTIKFAYLLFTFALFCSPVFAHQITIDTTDISTAISVTGQTRIPSGTIGTWELLEGDYKLYSYPGGNVATFSVQADGTITYDPSYEGTVLAGSGTSSVFIVGHPVLFDGTQVDITVYEYGLGAIDSTAKDGFATYRLPANVERLSYQDYHVFSLRSGSLARFWVDADGNVNYDPKYNGIISGVGTTTIVIIGYDIYLDGTQVDTDIYEYGLRNVSSTRATGTATYRLPANPYHDVGGNWGPYWVVSAPGGGIGRFEVEIGGTVKVEPEYEDTILGNGTSTVSIPGHSITIDASELDTELYEYQLRTIVGSAIAGQTFTYRFPANPQHSTIGPYWLIAKPGGGIVRFQVEIDGTISFEPGYEGIASGAGTSTLSVPGHPITIDATELDTELYEYQLRTLIGSALAGQKFTYNLPANPVHSTLGPYTLLSKPGGRITVFQVDIDGTVSFEEGYDGLATGSGTPTLFVPGYPITIDASELDTELYEYQLRTIVGSALAGQAFTYNLPANTEHGPWGPYQLLSYPGGRLAVFQIDADGTVSYDVVYEGVVAGIGTQQLTGVPYLVSIDATDVDPADSVYIDQLNSILVPGETTGDLRLPANPDHGPWGPYNLRSKTLFWIPEPSFKINSGGTCSVDEFVYDYGTVRLYCSLYNPDSEAPLTSNVEVAPNPVEINTDVTLTAIVDDSQTGESIVSLTEYNIDDTGWVAISGSYDDVTEQVSFVIPATSFAVPEVYEICVRGVDEPGNIGVKECTLLAAYDPEGGFVTGGGWILSPAGAYKPDTSLEGKANFGFVSKYKKGASIPTGNTEFQFKTGDLNFKSQAYDWLVVTGNATAKYKGFGTINGSGNFKFMIWAQDFEPDTFRIKIWEEDEFEIETVTYDNGFDQEISGGNIKVHDN